MADNASHGYCSTCKFFSYYSKSDRGQQGKPPDDATPGICHRYPQPINKVGGDWCGEHKTKSSK